MCGILIISEQIDTSTNIVCSWLNYYDCPYLRLGFYDLIFRVR